MVPAQLEKRHPGALVLDVTSKGPDPWRRLSPFFPHGGLPVPGGGGRLAASVEGIWQGLKVFESADVDEATFDNDRMVGLKRTVRRFGRCLGHREGLVGERLLGYREARWAIYLPAYRYVLEHACAPEIQALRGLAGERDLVLLDYTTNGDPDRLEQPLSHAALVAAFVEDRWPVRADT
ncbi:MAG: hypothetical protein H6738_05155 [Alphaproteobacteria bacterium]|nr:hypothetical protein [Alphaproteobacteria bacterium]MCB9696154.1 hypothetical protein [Alphaproteobacteria bacterium]